MVTTARQLTLLFALSFVLMLSPAWADGNKLLRNCKATLRVWDNNSNSTDDLMNSALCIGYITGIWDTILTFQAGSDKIKGACFPENATTGQMVRVVVKFLEENPKDLHNPEAILVLKTFNINFPCK